MTKDVPPANGFLVDLDGTLVSGRTALPDAPALLEAVRERFVIVSNDAENTPAQLSADLCGLGLAVPADRIVTAGTATLDLLAAEMPGAGVLLLGSDALSRYARERGLHLDDDRPDLVVLARDRSFSYARLTAAANAVQAGAALVATNPDLTHPGTGGSIVPETGSLLAALLACTGPVPHRVIGKPEPFLFRLGLALLGTKPGDTVMIGDNPATDGDGARRLGIGYFQVEAARQPARHRWQDGPVDRVGRVADALS